MLYGLIDKGVVAVVVEWDGVSKHNDADRLVKLPEGKPASEWIGMKKEDIAGWEPARVAPNPYPAPGPANNPPPHERVQPEPVRMPQRASSDSKPVPVSPPPAPKPAPVPPEQRAGPDPQTIKSVEKK